MWASTKNFRNVQTLFNWNQWLSPFGSADHESTPGWNTTVEMKEKQVQNMYMSQVEDGIGMQDAYVHIKLKKKKNEEVIEGLVVSDEVVGE